MSPPIRTADPAEPGAQRALQAYAQELAERFPGGFDIEGALETVVREGERRTVVLDTNGALTEAVAMYRARGYTDVPRYNDNPDATHWFAKALV